MEIGLGILMSGTISSLAYYKKALSKSGAVAATILGTMLFFTGGWLVFTSMLLFFISSSLLSKGEKKPNLLEEKGSQRDAVQVFANGIVALLFAILYKSTGQVAFQIGAVMAFATTNGDTWASEIGKRSGEIPVYLLKRTKVEIGLSGGVTVKGLLASFLGAWVIGLWYFIFQGIGEGFTLGTFLISLWISLAGFLGATIDSIMGETVQVKYRSWKQQGKLTEKKVEEQIENQIACGIQWMDNNMVNLLSSFLATVIGVLSITWM